MRAGDFGLTVGSTPSGAGNTIGDVPGVLVGHATLSCGAVQTGVTAILPNAGNLFQDKPIAAGYVLNGFGKSTGIEKGEILQGH